ncbi:MAG: hypothetical protein K8F27_07430 [Sulfuricellaceae bacterium]|nr:hypothetical protein [Sulfuricellaceae bacterium]
MNQATINALILVSPLVVGGAIAAINSNGINDTTENIEAWTRRTQTNVSAKRGWFYRYVLNPILWVLVKFSDWSDSFAHRGAKNGIRTTAALYLITAWCFLIYVAVAIIVGIVMIIAMIYIASLFLGGESNSSEEDNHVSERKRQLVGPRGTRLVKEGLFLDTPTGTKITEDGRIVKEGIFSDTPTGMKIDEDGRLVKEGIFSDTPTGTKINDKGQIVQEGLFVDSPSGTKIDSDGRIVEEGLFSDSPTGMKFKK